METENIFRVILPILILAFVVHRGFYVKIQSKPEDITLKQREEGIVSKIARELGLIGFISMAYVINHAWLAWTSLYFPMWLRWSGVGMAILGFVLMQWSQKRYPIVGATHRA